MLHRAVAKAIRLQCGFCIIRKGEKKRFDVGNQKRVVRWRDGGKREIMSSKRTCGVDRRLCPLAVDSAMRSWFARMYLIARGELRTRASEWASEQLRASFSNQGEWCSQNDRLGRCSEMPQLRAISMPAQFICTPVPARGPTGHERPIRDPIRACFHAWL